MTPGIAINISRRNGGGRGSPNPLSRGIAPRSSATGPSRPTRPSRARRRELIGSHRQMSIETHIPVRPIAPVVGYIGGKRKLAPHILPWIDAAEHDCYAEPFAGMLGLFFQRRRRAPAERVNDVSRDVATFFRIVQRHYPAFVEFLRYQVSSRAEFDRLIAVDPDTMTDIERAGRFLYLQSLSFGGKVAGRTFGVELSGAGGFDLSRLGPLLDAAHTRLSGVVIENLPYGEFIRRYDSPRTLFYVDPPYVESETYYGRGVFGREDFGRLADQLRGIEGRCVVSINDHPVARAAFDGFHVEAVPYKYTVARGDQRDVVELIIVGPPERVWERGRVQGDLPL